MSNTTYLLPSSVVNTVQLTTELVVTLGAVPTTATYSPDIELIQVQQNSPIPVTLSLSALESITIS